MLEASVSLVCSEPRLLYQVMCHTPPQNKKQKTSTTCSGLSAELNEYFSILETVDERS